MPSRSVNYQGYMYVQATVYKSDTIFLTRSKHAPKDWCFDHVGFIDKHTGKFIQMSGRRHTEGVFPLSKLSDDSAIGTDVYSTIALPKTVMFTSALLGAVNCVTFVVEVLKANRIHTWSRKGFHDLFSCWPTPQEKFVRKGSVPIRAMHDYYAFDEENPLSIEEVTKKWVQDHDKPNNWNGLRVYYPFDEVWKYREYNRDIQGNLSEEEWADLRDSMKEHGWDKERPLMLLIGKNGVAKVGEGNHRLIVARELGIDKIPVSFGAFYKNVEPGVGRGRVASCVRYHGALYQLVEAADPQRDREFRQEAKTAYRKMIDYLSQPPSVLRNEIVMGDGSFSFLFARIDMKYKDLFISFEEIAEPVSGEFANLISGDDLKYSITFFTIPEELLLEGDMDKIVGSFHRQALEPIFVHEFIHYLDSHRRGTPDLSPKEIADRKDRKKSRTKYLNNAEEFNAWYQAKVDELENTLNIIQREKAGLDFLLTDYMVSFKVFLHRALLHFDIDAPRWGTIDLRKKWKRKLTQRLYKFYTDYKKALQDKGDL